MKTLPDQKPGYQGDIKLQFVAELPPGCVERRAAGNVHIVAHSETGHHHVVASQQARVFGTADPLVCYLQIDGDYADLMHCRDVNSHETWRITGRGKICKITRQRERTPEGWRVVQD